MAAVPGDAAAATENPAGRSTGNPPSGPTIALLSEFRSVLESKFTDPILSPDVGSPALPHLHSCVQPARPMIREQLVAVAQPW